MKKQVFQWIGAVIIASVIMNFILAFYNRAAGWIDRTEGSTTAIYHPGSSMLMGTEGHGYHKVDKRGYVNDVDELADNYVIAIGASYTQGKEVKAGKRYTDLLNGWLGYTDEAYVYNVSQDAYYFPKIIKGFTALTQEFPGVSKIIIEIGKTDFDPHDLENALEQRGYDEMKTGENILSTLSKKKKINILIKEYSPLFYNVNNKIKQIGTVSGVTSKKKDIDLESYAKWIDADMKFISESYNGKIIILFHPETSINSDGTLEIRQTDTDSIFIETCEKYGIEFVDMTDRFLEEYIKNYKLPYGFTDSIPGYGHINEAGHQMIAEELYKVIN